LVYLNIAYNELNSLPTDVDPDLSVIVQEIMDKYNKVGEEIAEQDLKNIEDKKNNDILNKPSDKNEEYFNEYNYALKAYSQMKKGNEIIGINYSK